MIRPLALCLTAALFAPDALAQAPAYLYDNPAWWTANAPRNVRLADLDNDGDLDMLVAGRRRQIAVHINTGDGAMLPAQFIDVGDPAFPNGTETEDIELGDLNGDGFIDFAIANVASGTLQTFINNGDGSFTLRDTIHSPDGEGFSDVAIGDPNQDGLGDLVGVQGGSDFIRLYLAQPGGGYGANIPAFLPNSPSHAQFADADGDGLLDLFICAADGPNPTGAPGFVACFINGGFDETTGEWNNYDTFAVFNATTNPLPTNFELADMDGDGAVDIVISTNNFLSNGFIEVLLNTGAGSFTPASSTPVAFSANGMDVGDLNGDGLLDVVCANANDQDEITVLLRTDATRGAIEFGDVRPLIGVNDIAIDAKLGDLDGDGDIDIAIGCIGGQSVNALINDGEANFERVDNYALTDPQANIIHAMDIDDDGDEDLLTITDRNGPLYVSISTNDGSGVFTPGPALEILPERVSLNAAADFNGDGRTDVLLYEFQTGNMRILFNNGNGTVTLGPPFTAPGQAFVFGLTAFDVDGDGDTDIFTTGSASSSLDSNKVFLNDGTGAFTEVDQFLFTSYAIDPFPCDFDGDGDLDLVTADLFRDPVLLRNNGDGTFSEAGTLANTSSSISGIVADDFDGDGAKDIAVLNRTVLEIALYVGDGTDFGFLPPTSIPLGPSATRIGLADPDGDGDNDFILNIDQGNGLDVSQMYALGVMINNGDGTFGPLTGYHCRGRPQGQTFADFNNDGLLDAAVGVSTFDESFFVFLQRNNETTSVCLGDCDESGAVNFNDLVAMLFQFGADTGDGCDANDDGDINFNDLVAALFLFGPCPQ